MRRALVLLVTAVLLLGAKPGEQCPMPQPDPNAAKSLYSSLSLNAELVAPTAVGSRRRPVAGQPGSPSAGTIPIVNFIDTQIQAKLTRDHVVPTQLAGDEEFLRRVTLDLTGQIPDATAVTAFVADATPDKRARKIDELLASEAFVDRWTLWYGDLVQNVQISTNARMYYLGRNVYYTFIKDSIRANKPYDQLVRETLTGRGDSFVNGPSNYVVRQLQNNGPPQDTYDNLAAHAGEKFLGMPMLCLSCHNGAGHLELVNMSLAVKQRKDFWGMAAFFSRTQARPEIYQTNIRKFQVTDNTNGRYLLNTTDGNKSPRQPNPGESNVVNPSYFFTAEQPRANEPYRDAYARMLTADRQFARAAVNYLWKEMFGLGIVEPANSFDLLKLSTQPTHPELLEALTSEFIATGYSLKSILRTMAMSSTYQLSAKYTPGAWNEAWVPYFARRYPRRMMAEMLFDAMIKATGVPATLQAQGIGAVQKAVALPDPLEPGPRSQFGIFINNFGRGDRDDTLRTNDSSISQALALMNDPIVTTRVRRSTANSTVARTLASTSDPGAIADQLYLATLSRRPTAEERQLAVDYLRGGTLQNRAEDLQFVLLNTLEFLFH